MQPSRSGRDALIHHARRLFAERGYHGTSVADVQAAAGLAPGSGALYKHFASKRALLEAVAGSGGGFAPTEPLESVGRRLLDSGASLHRPDAALADWLRAAVRGGRLRDHDCDAVAVLLAAALAHRRAAAALLGLPAPDDPDDDRLLDAWIDLVLTALDPRHDLGDDVG